MENELFNLNTVLKLRKEVLVAIKALKFTLSHYEINDLRSLDFWKLFNFISSIEMIANELKIECRIKQDELTQTNLLEH